jgi:hypothetical protein
MYLTRVLVKPQLMTYVIFRVTENARGPGVVLCGKQRRVLSVTDARGRLLNLIVVGWTLTRVSE